MEHIVYHNRLPYTMLCPHVHTSHHHTTIPIMFVPQQHCRFSVFAQSTLTPFSYDATQGRKRPINHGRRRLNHIAMIAQTKHQTMVEGNPTCISLTSRRCSTYRQHLRYLSPTSDPAIVRFVDFFGVEGRKDTKGLQLFAVGVALPDIQYTKLTINI